MANNLTLQVLFNIEKKYSHKETAKIVGEALNLVFEKDDSGRWEEYPAYMSIIMGIELALLAPPEPEFDLREEPEDIYQLTSRDHTPYTENSAEVDLSTYLATIIESKTGLKCVQIS
ncbi:hypothetical protein ACJJIR_12650 [Microbulbifer sp. SSSA008]|uniref:hypothetical protein n=1 Tax=Microbulbifer sp. SSSA008 TaxID=3243380 RepID=UPI00403A2B5F